MSKVIVLIGDKTGKEKPSVLGFFVMPDGKHIITGDQSSPSAQIPLPKPVH